MCRWSMFTLGIPSMCHWCLVGLECARWSPFVKDSILGRKGGRHIGGDPVMKLWLFGGVGIPEDSVVAVSGIFPFPIPGHLSSSWDKRGSQQRLLSFLIANSAGGPCSQSDMIIKGAVSPGSLPHMHLLVAAQGSTWSQTVSSGRGSGAAHDHTGETSQGA